MNKVRAHVLVSGKVQGVFFRQKTGAASPKLSGLQVGYERN